MIIFISLLLDKYKVCENVCFVLISKDCSLPPLPPPTEPRQSALSIYVLVSVTMIQFQGQPTAVWKMWNEKYLSKGLCPIQIIFYAIK